MGRRAGKRSKLKAQAWNQILFRLYKPDGGSKCALKFTSGKRAERGR